MTTQLNRVLIIPEYFDAFMAMEEAQCSTKLERARFLVIILARYHLVLFCINFFIDLLLLLIGKVFELTQIDDNATVLTQIGRLQFEKEALATAKDTTEKGKAETMDKVKQIFKINAKTKLFHNKVGTQIKKANGQVSDLQTKVDACLRWWDRLFFELQIKKANKEVSNEKAQKWEVVYKDQVEYIHYLVFILGSHMDKIP